MFYCYNTLSVSLEKGEQMPIAHPANEKVVVLNGKKLCEYIALKVEYKISVIDSDLNIAHDLLISFNGTRFFKNFASTRIAAEEAHFILIDLTKSDIESQVVGVAEVDADDESQPGEVHFLD